MNTNPKALVIGLAPGELAPHRTVPWSSAHQVTIFDFHIVIALCRAFNEQADKFTLQSLAELQRKFRALLKSRGELVVVVDEFKEHPIPAGPKHVPRDKNNCTFALPIPVPFTQEPGDTIEAARESNYDPYLDRLKRWRFHFASTDKPPTVVAYRTNRAGRAIAGRLSHSGIYFDLLPQVPELSNIDTAREILRLSGFDGGTLLAPKWTEEIDVPGASDIRDAIGRAEQAISDSKNRIAQLKAQLKSITKYRKLLYGTGDELAEIAQDTFELLGATVISDHYSTEDLLLKIGEVEYLVEITGTTNSLPLKKVRQAADTEMDVEERSGKRLKSILLATPLRETPLSERSSTEKPEFPDNVRTRAKELNIALVSGRWLFEQVCEVLKGNSHGAEVLARITASAGVLE